jgi:hypothetical protein
VPIVSPGRRARRRWHGLKLTIGLLTMSLVAVLCAAAGFSALRSIGEGDGMSAGDEYLAGQGEEFSSSEGRFRAEFPSEPDTGNNDTINVLGGEVAIHGVEAPLGDVDNTGVHISWFDLPNAPSAKDAAGVLKGVAVFHAQEFESTPAAGHSVERADHPSYEYELDLTIDDAAVAEPVSELVTVRLVLVEARVYVLWIDGVRAEHELLDYLALSFRPR